MKKCRWGMALLGFVCAVFIMGRPVSAVETTSVNVNTPLFANSAPAMYTYAMYQQDLVLLLQKYPGKLTVSSLGQSVQGREIYQVILGNPNAKHAVFIDSTIHAREYINTQLVMSMIDQYAGTDLGDLCFYIVPMINPDGVTLCQIGPAGLSAANIGFTQAAYGVEKRSYKTMDNYVNKWKANANGVDLNRNFPTGWAGSTQKGYPSNALFKGAAPASEPETKIMMTAVLQRPFELALNYHSCGQVIYYGSQMAKPEVRTLCKVWADYVGMNTGYRLVGSSATGEFGTYADYLAADVGIPSVTIETGARMCPTGADEFPSIYAHNIGLWGNLIKHYQAYP